MLFPFYFKIFKNLRYTAATFTINLFKGIANFRKFYDFKNVYFKMYLLPANFLLLLNFQKISFSKRCSTYFKNFPFNSFFNP